MAATSTHITSSPQKIAFASSIGAIIEWYDFFLYGVVSALVFNKLFFPAEDPYISTILTWTTYAVGFVSRPVGGIIFGHFGDRIGRKTILVLTLLIMGVATFLIGLLPTYQQIGIWAPIALLILRVLQGIGIGGEWGGAVLMAFEHAPKEKRGFYGSWVQIGVPAGLCLSAGVVAVLSLMPEQQFLEWGWRIAFLLSAFLVLIGIYIRSNVMETPDFSEVKKKGTEARVPFVELFRTSSKNVILGMGARYIEGVCFNVYGVFVISYLTGNLNVPRSTALSAVTFASFVMIFVLPFAGALSDKIGRRALFGLGAILTGLMGFPAMFVISTQPNTIWMWLAILVPFALIYPALYGTQAALFAELFDSRVRYTGIAFVYNTAGIFSSGLTPLIGTYLLHANGGQPWLLAVYVLIVSAISTLSVYLMASPKTPKQGDSKRDAAAVEPTSDPSIAMLKVQSLN